MSEYLDFFLTFWHPWMIFFFAFSLLLFQFLLPSSDVLFDLGFSSVWFSLVLGATSEGDIYAMIAIVFLIYMLFCVLGRTFFLFPLSPGLVYLFYVYFLFGGYESWFFLWVGMDKLNETYGGHRLNYKWWPTCMGTRQSTRLVSTPNHVSYVPLLWASDHCF